MKIKKGYVLKEVAGNIVVVNVGGNLNFNGIIRLNETAALLWSILEKGTDSEKLITAMTSEYEIDRATAEKDVTQLLLKLEDAGILE